jgi:type VI protein secretion system component Hcp
MEGVMTSLSGQVNLASATEGVASSNTTIVTFTDSNPSDPANNFTALINWGDGTTSWGTVSGSNGSFTVTGTHTYANEGSDNITATITGTGPDIAAPTNLQYFLAIDGLNGGSTDAAHSGWFNVSSYDVGALVAAITTGGTGGSATPPTFSPLTVTLPATGLTGALADLARGRHIQSIRLEGVTSSGQAVYDLTLGDVTVTGYDDTAGGDKLTFSYQQVALTTTPINPDGSLGAPQSFSFNLATDTVDASIPAPVPGTGGAIVAPPVEVALGFPGYAAVVVFDSKVMTPKMA